MGSAFSLLAQDQVDESSQHVSLQQQRVGTSRTLSQQYVAHTNTAVSVPACVSLEKKCLGLMVRPESIHIFKKNSIIELSFFYKSDYEAVLDVTYSTFSGDLVVPSTTVSLPDTRVKGKTDFSEFAICTGIADGLLDSLLSIGLRIHNKEGSLDIVAECNRGVVNLREMSFDSGSGRVELLQLFNASSSSASPTTPSSKQQKCCAVCLSNEPSVGFLPCRHVCVCGDCAHGTLASSSNHCPICRAVVTGTINVD
jgi:hypothetical protein